MSAPGAGAAQVEKALDDLIARLSKGDSTADVRAALIEARRLRNVTLRWAAIPPPPDARREMMTRVMDLVAKAGLAARASKPPGAPSVPPPSAPVISVHAPVQRALSPFGGSLAVDRDSKLSPPMPMVDHAPAHGLPAASPSKPAPAFRANQEGAMTRPRANGAPPPPPRASLERRELPELDEVAPPRSPPRMAAAPSPAAPAPETKQAPAPASQKLSPIPGARNLSPIPGARNLSPIPGARNLSPSPSPVVRASSPGTSAKHQPSPLPSALRIPSPGPPGGRRATAAGLRPVGPARDSVPAALAPAQGHEPLRKKAPTLEFEAGPSSARAPGAGAPPPLQRSSLPPTPRVDPEAFRDASVLRSRAPQRAHTIAGIPEANEAMLEAIQMRRDAESRQATLAAQLSAHSDDEAAVRSQMPTAAPPPMPTTNGPSSSRAPPPLRRNANKETLMMGALGTNALEALRGGRAPMFPEEELELEHPPITKPSSPANPANPESEAHGAPPADSAPASARASGFARSPVPPPISQRPLRASSPPILAVQAQREGRVDGFSTAVSVPSMPSVQPGQRKPSSPTQIMGTPTPTPPPLAPHGARTSEKPLRTVIGPGVTIVRPDSADWQPHPICAGVTVKLLYRDPRSGVYTALLRLGPGAALGKRRHAAAEEMLLVSGIALVGAHEMRAGEYCRAEAETVHETITTTTGCTFFLCGSENDEFLDEA